MLRGDLNCCTVSQALISSVQRLKYEGKSFDFKRASINTIKRTESAPWFSRVFFTATTLVAVAICIFGGLCLVAIDRLLCHSS